MRERASIALRECVVAVIVVGANILGVVVGSHGATESGGEGAVVTGSAAHIDWLRGQMSRLELA